MEQAEQIEYDLMLDLHGEQSEIHTTLSPVLNPDGAVETIIGTSIKQSDKSAVRLHISLEIGPEGGVICVADDGPGLPDSDLRFLEEGKFEYGMGFGLLGIRRLIKTRSGHLSAAPRPYGGTFFRIALPGLTEITG